MIFQYPIGNKLESAALDDTNTLDYLEVEGIALSGHSTSPWLAVLVGSLLLGSALGVVLHSSMILNFSIAKCSLSSYCINVKENVRQMAMQLLQCIDMYISIMFSFDLESISSPPDI